MSEDSKKWRWRVGMAVPVFVALLTWVLNAFEVRSVWSSITAMFGATPTVVYWVLALVAAFLVGQRMGRARGPQERANDAEAEARLSAAASEADSIAEAEPVTEAEAAMEPDVVTEANAIPEWVAEAEARDLVQQSNYWSRITRRRALDQLEAKFEYEEYGIEVEPEPLEIESAAIAPPRHTPNVDAVLQHFWDDNPAARNGPLYQSATLLDWLEEQTHDVTLPNL